MTKERSNRKSAVPEQVGLGKIDHERFSEVLLGGMEISNYNKRRLAIALGSHPSTIGRLLNGDIELSTSWVYAIADEVDMSRAKLLEAANLLQTNGLSQDRREEVYKDIDKGRIVI